MFEQHAFWRELLSAADCALDRLSLLGPDACTARVPVKKFIWTLEALDKCLQETYIPGHLVTSWEAQFKPALDTLNALGSQRAPKKDPSALVAASDDKGTDAALHEGALAEQCDELLGKVLEANSWASHVEEGERLPEPLLCLWWLVSFGQNRVAPLHQLWPSLSDLLERAFDFSVHSSDAVYKQLANVTHSCLGVSANSTDLSMHECRQFFLRFGPADQLLFKTTVTCRLSGEPLPWFRPTFSGPEATQFLTDRPDVEFVARFSSVEGHLVRQNRKRKTLIQNSKDGYRSQKRGNLWSPWESSLVTVMRHWEDSDVPESQYDEWYEVLGECCNRHKNAVADEESRFGLGTIDALEASPLPRLALLVHDGIKDKRPPSRMLKSTWRVLFMCEGDGLTGGHAADAPGRQSPAASSADAPPRYFNECHFVSDADPFALELSQEEVLEVVPLLRVAVRVLTVATRKSMCGRIPFLETFSRIKANTVARQLFEMANKLDELERFMSGSLSSLLPHARRSGGGGGGGGGGEAAEVNGLAAYVKYHKFVQSKLPEGFVPTDLQPSIIPDLSHTTWACKTHRSGDSGASVNGSLKERMRSGSYAGLTTVPPTDADSKSTDSDTYLPIDDLAIDEKSQRSPQPPPSAQKASSQIVIDVTATSTTDPTSTAAADLAAEDDGGGELLLHRSALISANRPPSSFNRRSLKLGDIEKYRPPPVSVVGIDHSGDEKFFDDKIVDRLSIGRSSGRRLLAAEDVGDSELDRIRRNSIDTSAHLHSPSFNLRQQSQQQGSPRSSDRENSRSESRSLSSSPVASSPRSVRPTRPPASPSTSPRPRSLSKGASGRFLRRALTRAKSALGASSADLARPPVCALRVELRSAASIRNTDTGMFGDLSDPFCAVYVYDRNMKRLKKRKTQIAKNNLNPVWDEVFEWQHHEYLERLDIEVWDRSKFFKDDMVGFATIRLSSTTTGSFHMDDEIQLLDSPSRTSRTVDATLTLAVAYEEDTQYTHQHQQRA